MKKYKCNSELIERYWHFGCLSNELNKEGDYILYKLEKSDVVLYHDGNEVIAFDNRCPHRGAHFFKLQNGNERAVCKYHGWSFTSGRLVIPLKMELMDGCPSPELKKYHVEWCGSFLFFAINPKVELIQQLGTELYSLVESLSFDCVSRKDLNQYVYECPWQVAIENALEPQHLPYIHKETLNKLNLINCRNHYWGSNSGVYFDIGNASQVRALNRISKYYDLSEDVHPGYMSLFLFPFCFISSTAGISYSVQSFFPRSGGGTLFSSRLYSVRLSSSSYVAADSALLMAAVEMNHRVFEEDHEICKQISEDAWERSLINPLYVSEEKILHFRNQLTAI